MSKFFDPELSGLKPYKPGEQPRQGEKLTKLNTNENPYDPSPKVIEAVSSQGIRALRRYPDPDTGELLQAVAEYYGISEDNVIAGNGSDDILAFSYMAFQKENKKIYYPEISYGFYPVYAQLFKLDGRTIPMGKGLTIDIEKYKYLDGTVIIANPNAPTGTALRRCHIEEIVKSNPGNVVIIDEAYVDFGGETSVPLINSYDNLLIIQTLSKSRSLAGGRVGYAIGSGELIEDLGTVKYSFNPYGLDSISIAAATAAIKDREYFEMTRGRIMKTRDETSEKLKELGFEVLPSEANFIFVKHAAMPGEMYFKALRQNSIIVRHFDRPQIKDYVRITIGTDNEMHRLVEVTERIIEKSCDGAVKNNRDL